MSFEHAMGDPAELAALYVAGALTDEQVADFESHLRHGCALCAAELRGLEGAAAALLRSVEPIEPEAGVKAALLARLESPQPDGDNPQVWKQWQTDAHQAGLFVRRAGEGEWEPTGIAGIDIRRLFVDRDRDQITMLVRMAAGTAYPRHVHGGPEECFVLEGDLYVDDDELGAGDYQRAAPGSKHGIQRTERGCTLLIVSSLSDELVA